MMNAPNMNPSKANQRKKWLVGALVVCPVLVLGGGAFIVRQQRDSYNLEALVAEAKTHNLPFEAKDLADPKPVLDSENSFRLVDKLMKDFPNLDPISKDVTNHNLSNQKISSTTVRFIGDAKAIAKFKAFDAHKDYDLGASLLYREYPYIKLVARTLAMQAELEAAKGNVKAAVECLDEVKNIANQLSHEKVYIGALLKMAVQQYYYLSAAKVMNLASANPASLEVVKSSLSVPIEEINLKTSFRGEFYYGVTFCRNFELLGGHQALVSETYDFGDIDPKKLVRTGLPKTDEPKGILATYITDMLMVQKIFESEPDMMLAGQKADAAIEALPPKDSHSFVRLISPMWGGAGFGWEKPKLMRTILLKSVDLLQQSKGNNFPESIPNISDPIAGGFVHYKRTPKGFSLYSFGKNQKDDGGPSNLVTGQISDDFGFEFPMALAK